MESPSIHTRGEQQRLLTPHESPERPKRQLIVDVYSRTSSYSHVESPACQTIIEGVMAEARNRSIEELAHEEKEMLLGLLSLHTRSAAAPVSAKKGGQA